MATKLVYDSNGSLARGDRVLFVTAHDGGVVRFTVATAKDNLCVALSDADARVLAKRLLEFYLDDHHQAVPDGT
jgi:hypothetical protein